MSFLNKLLTKKTKNDIKYVQAEDYDEITAVIAATIACMDEEEEIAAAIISAISMFEENDELIVRNIKRTAELDSIWAHEGRMKLMR